MTPPSEHFRAMVELARGGRTDAFVALAHKLEAADLADILSELDEDERVRVVRALPPELSGEALAEMPEEAHAEDTLVALEPEQAAEILEELEDDDAADLLRELDPEQQERILAEVEDRSEVDRLLRYDEESAGGRMTTHVVTVRDTDTAAQALEAIRRQSDKVEDFYQIFVVDGARRLAGIAPLARPRDQSAGAPGARVHDRRRALRCSRRWTRRRWRG